MTVRIQLRHCLGAMALIGTLTVATACAPNNQPNGPSTPHTTATSTAPSSTTPTPTPNPTPVGVAEADKKAAIAAFTKATEIIDEAFISRATAFPTELDKYVDPKSNVYQDQLDGLIESYTVGWHQTGYTAVSETSATAMQNGDIDLFACVDGTKVITDYPYLGPKPGGLAAGHFIMSKVSSGWKITNYGKPKFWRGEVMQRRKINVCALTISLLVPTSFSVGADVWTDTHSSRTAEIAGRKQRAAGAAGVAVVLSERRLG